MMCRIDVLFPTRDTGVLIWIPRFRGYQSPRRFGRYHSPRGLRLIPFVFSSYRELFMFSTMLRSLRISASYLLTRWMDRQHIRNTPRQQPTIMPRINQRIPIHVAVVQPLNPADEILISHNDIPCPSSKSSLSEPSVMLT